MSGTYGWDLDAGGSGSNQKAEFTKFPVGATRIRILEEAPYVRWTHWMPKHNRSINCPGVKVCPIDDIIAKQKQNGEKPTYNSARRFAINVWNYETNRAEIMEQGKTFFEDLKMVMSDLKEDNKVLTDVVLRVRRQGTGKEDTKYRIDVQGNAEGNVPVESIIDLKDYFKPHTPEQITRILNGEDWDEVMKGEEENPNALQNDPNPFEGDEEIEVN